MRPRRTSSDLLADPRQLVYASEMLLLMAVLYTGVGVGFAIVRKPLAIPRLIPIPAENYYFWETIFAIPVFVLAWILAAGLAHLLSKWFRGQGTFQGTLAVLGFALSVPNLAMWVVDAPLAVLFLAGVLDPTELATHPGLFWRILNPAYQFVALVWYFGLVLTAVGVAQRLRWWQATIVGALTPAIVGIVVFVFIR